MFGSIFGKTEKNEARPTIESQKAPGKALNVPRNVLAERTPPPNTNVTKSNDKRPLNGVNINTKATPNNPEIRNAIKNILNNREINNKQKLVQPNGLTTNKKINETAAELLNLPAINDAKANTKANEGKYISNSKSTYRSLNNSSSKLPLPTSPNFTSSTSTSTSPFSSAASAFTNKNLPNSNDIRNNNKNTNNNRNTNDNRNTIKNRNRNNTNMTNASNNDKKNNNSLKLGKIAIYVGGITTGNKRFKKSKQASMIRKISQISKGTFQFKNGTSGDETKVSERQSAFILLNLLKSTNPFVFRELMMQLTKFPEKGMPSNISFKQAAVNVHIMKNRLPVKSKKKSISKHSPI